jgi:ribosomal protein S18 acetylase RimI-like enzyme
VDQPQQVEVQALESKYLDDIIRIHLEGLGYTLNSRLGPRHLGFLYQTMAGDPMCYVGMALVAGVPVGVVSGTLDANSLKSRVLRSMTVMQGLGIAKAFVLEPRLLMDWLKESIIGSSLRYDGGQVVATLTTLAVDSRFRGRGAGRQLVKALESFFAARNVLIYRLETLLGNETARGFYSSLGFKEADRRAGSYVMVKRVAA